MFKMKLINLLRPQHFATPEGEKKMIQAMMLNAYNQGLIAGETRGYSKVIDLLHAEEVRFLSVLDRRQAERLNLSETVRSLLCQAGKPEETHVKGGITEKK